MPTKRPIPDETFETYVTQTLNSQNETLQRLETRLTAPALNGGFDKLVQRVAKIDSVVDQLKETTDKHVSDTNQKVTELHDVVFDPETGLYHKVKGNSLWIDKFEKNVKWIGKLVLAAFVAGAGKLVFTVYSYVVQHIRFTP